jgi:GT2 family glycosyltransferase
VQAGAAADPRGELWGDVEAVVAAGRAPLVAPAAVRLIDLDGQLAEVRLPRARDGRAYRSLLAVARLDGRPLGAASFSVGGEGRVPRPVLELGFRRALNGRPARSRADARDGPSSLTSSVSVVVTTCSNPVALDGCLRSLLACDYDDVEVIVVENRPGSGATRQLLTTSFAGYPELRYVEEPRPGLSRARNRGLAAAQGDLVAFVDDDTFLDRGWIRCFAERFERGGDVDCVTGLILPLELESDSQLLLDQFAGFGKGFRPRTFRHSDDDGMPVFPYAPGAIGSGANTVMRRSVALAVGGFDSNLGAGTPAAGGEDLDLYMRLILEGHVIAYEPSAIVWHRHPDGPERLQRQVYRYGVGLGATLAKQVFCGPARRELLRAVPAGVRYATDPQSRKNAAKSADYPRRLDWLECAGVLIGPAAYALSATAGRLRRRANGAPTVPNPYRQRVVLPNGRAVDLAAFDEEVRRSGRAAPSRTAALEHALTPIAMAACIAAPLASALGLPAAIRLATVLMLLCIAPGATLVGALGGRGEPGLVVGTSLACSALIAQSMLWLGTWWPKAFLYLLAGVCLLTLATHARAQRPRARASPGAARRVARKLAPDIAAHIVLIAVAMAVWGASLSDADLSRIAGIGLLNALPPAYFVGFGLLLAGFVVAVSRSVVSPKLLALYVVALIVVLHGTTPFLYDEPRYPWTYTHLGVINLIAENGAVDRHVDIYNNWPAFFALNAWLSRVTGVAPAAYAEWAQLFFNLANVAAIRFALRGVTSDERLLWSASWLFVLGNWIGQDYLAPQAFAFVVAVVVIGLALRVQLPARAPRTRPGLWLTSAVARLRGLIRHGRVLPEPRRASPLSPRGALLVGSLCYVAVVVSHQLTPLVLLAGITALALIARRVPLWVPVAMAVAEVAWVALAWPYVSEHYAIFDPEPGSSAAPAGYHLGSGLPGFALVSYAARVEVLVFVGLAGAGLVRRLRARRWDLTVALLVAAPVLIIGLNSYGGEGRYRFFLFALPWLCFFAAVACAPARSTRLKAALRGWRLAIATALLGICVLFAYFGLELSNRVTSDDVDATAWFERHAPPDSLLVGMTPSFPRRVSARYADVYLPDYPGAPALTDHPRYRRARLDGAELAHVEATIARYGVRHTYFMITPSQERYGRLFGLLRPGSSLRLARALRTSRAFGLVYQRGPAFVFRYRAAEKRRPP